MLNQCFPGIGRKFLEKKSFSHELGTWEDPRKGSPWSRPRTCTFVPREIIGRVIQEMDEVYVPKEIMRCTFQKQSFLKGFRVGWKVQDKELVKELT